MSRLAFGAAAAAVVLLAAPAWAQPPGPTPEALAKAEQVNDEVVGLFKEICLDRFPDDAAIKAAAEGRKASALSPAEVRNYLKDDPGHGWRLTTPLGLSVITIEHPPVRACAVRRMTPSGLSSAKGYLAAITAFAQAHGETVDPTQQQKLALNGVDLTGFASILKKDGKPAEQMILIFSNYHGRVPAEFAPDAVDGVGVEVRLVRQPLN